PWKRKSPPNRSGLRSFSRAPMNYPKRAKSPGVFAKFRWSLPWLTRYPLWRAQQSLRRIADGDSPRHLILLVANHFEPGWTEDGAVLDWSRQLARLDDWIQQARAIGRAVQDCDGTAFRHTYFYPAEQYHGRLLERLVELQAEGLGEVE